MRALVLQHIACEPPGAYEDVLLEQGASIHRVELDEGDPLPRWQDFELVVAMGGPMSVNDEDEHAWLRDEKRLIREAVQADTPFWGACLGAQLLAASLGARVYAGAAPEVGVLPVELTEEAPSDPVFAAAPPEFATLQWHGDTFELPPRATLLASSPAYQNQAFRIRRAYAVQFHLEVSSEMAAEWGRVPAYASSLEQTQGPGALERLLAAFAMCRSEMEELARTLFVRWLERVATVNKVRV